MGALSSTPLSAEKKAEIDAKIKNSHVFVASKTFCPYCTRAKALLKEVGADDAEIVELDRDEDGSAIQAYLLEVSGQRTVPNIWIKGKHIGGSDDLAKLHGSGQLKSTL